MIIEGHFPAVQVTFATAKKDVAKALDDFRRHNPKAIPDSINDVEILYFCEGCSKPIMDGDKYGYDEQSGCHLCESCTTESAKEQANEIWTILEEECGASTTDRESFVIWAAELKTTSSKEFRFCGVFGMAGKVWVERDRTYVTGLNFDEMLRLETEDERVRLRSCESKANERLSFL